MKKITLFVLGMLFLTGCGEDTPNDKLTSEVIRPLTESGVKGVETTDFKRDNGWVDSQAPNRYVVQYTYNFKLTQPLAEVTLGLAKEYKAEADKLIQNSGFMGSSAKLDMSARAADWKYAQGEKYIQRRDSFVGKCAPCLAFWNQASSEQEASPRTAFILAWEHLETLGFSDSANTGDKVPRQAWAAFRKTEKGWAAVK